MQGKNSSRYKHLKGKEQATKFPSRNLQSRKIENLEKNSYYNLLNLTIDTVLTSFKKQFPDALENF